jgi:hypothetical protein
LPGSFALLQLFFLLARIFIDSMTGIVTGVAPSGVFPCGGAGAWNWSLLRCGGEDRGLDQVSAFSFRVVLVKLEALSLVICLVRGLNINLYLPFD